MSITVNAIVEDYGPAAGAGGELEQRIYGVNRRPIPATCVFRLQLHPLDRNRIRVEKWALVNSRTRTVTFVTTYNGRAGTRFDPRRNTHPFDLFWVCRKLQDYRQVPLELCPVATPDIAAEAADNWRWMVC